MPGTPSRFSLQGIGLLARRRYRTIFLICALLVGASIYGASRLKFDADVLNLLPQDEPEVKTFRQTLDEFGSIDLLLIVVRVPEEGVLDDSFEFADALADRLGNLDSLVSVEHRIGELTELVETYLPQALLFLDADGREAIEARVTAEALRERALELRRMLATPQALALKELAQLDPFGLSDLLIQRIAGAPGGLSVDWTSGYLLSRDHRLLLLLAQPARPAQDVKFSKQMVSEVQAEISLLREEFDPEAGQVPTVDLAGRYVMALGDEALIRRDAVVNIVTSMGGVLLLFLLAFRRFGLLLYAFLPLACGLLLTFGFSAVALGTISPATSGVAALLIGLGIDFVIVSYGRYVEERHAGADLMSALATMNGSSGRAVVVGGVTSAATFFAFGVTKFEGLSQMGFLTGTGILFCMLAVLFLLPALLAWSDDHHARRNTDQRLVLHGFGSAHIARFSIRRPWSVLSVGVLLTAIASYWAFGLRFDDSVQAMRPAGNPAARVWTEVAESFGSGLEQMMLVITAETEEEVVELADRAAAQAEKLVDPGILREVDGVASVIPPREQQRESLEWLAGARAETLNVSRIRDEFGEALTAAGMRSAPFERGLALFARAVERDRPFGLEELESTAQGRRVAQRYVHRLETGYRTVVYMYPPARIWAREAPPALHELAREMGPAVELTGANVVSAFLRERVLRDAVLAAVIGFFAVGLLLWLDFRRLHDTALALAPLVVGILWMFGLMSVSGLTMNFMNIFVSTMIIGIGVDYGVHMIHRFREGRDGDPETLIAGMIETSKAIVLAALSTTVGFGSLSLSSYPGLQSMGRVAVIGALSTSLVAITVLPAYLALRIRRKNRESHV